MSETHTIAFRANNSNHSAIVVEAKWPRSMISPDHLVLEQLALGGFAGDVTSYVVQLIAHGRGSFVAYPIDEAA